MLSLSITLVTLLSVSNVKAHIAAWSAAMYGLNATVANNGFPQDPLRGLPFSKWWFHGHLNNPPPEGRFLEFPAGGSVFVELSCDKAGTSFLHGTDIRQGNNICPGYPMSEYHTTGIHDLKGSAFGIVYKPTSEISSIKPSDITIFTVNATSPWERFTKYEVPAKMPACPEGGCTCAWFWIHSADSGQEQIYMNGHRCKITNVAEDGGSPLAQPQLARRCGADNTPEIVRAAAPTNCTYGAKQPLYWLQAEGNTFFEQSHAPPYYNSLYNFQDGAQNDIFVDSVLPTMDWSGHPVTGKLKNAAGSFAGSGGIKNVGSAPSSSASSSATPTSKTVIVHSATASAASASATSTVSSSSDSVSSFTPSSDTIVVSSSSAAPSSSSAVSLTPAASSTAAVTSAPIASSASSSDESESSSSTPASSSVVVMTTQATETDTVTATVTSSPAASSQAAGTTDTVFTTVTDDVTHTIMETTTIVSTMTMTVTASDGSESESLMTVTTTSTGAATTSTDASIVNVAPTPLSTPPGVLVNPEQPASSNIHTCNAKSPRMLRRRSRAMEEEKRADSKKRMFNHFSSSSSQKHRRMFNGRLSNSKL